jgi:serine-type D-Ala-D-Ala carboxypeptidase (penicillin-binding protein 5/6)
MSSRMIFLGVCSLVILIILYVAMVLLLPVPKPTLSLDIKSGPLDTGTAAAIPWPATGSAAIGVTSHDVLVSSNADQPTPTASIAKIILAIALLRAKPLNLDEPGPIITLNANDAAIYNAETARNGSAIPVETGEQLTQYQALQALLLPSGNNIATTLANWAFGSEQQYIDYANKLLGDMGLSKTHVADASGYSPHTISTPKELVQIGEAALGNPVIAQIVSQQQATLPVAGTVHNTNTLLGQGYNGIKTGHTDQSGGCLLFSAIRQISGQSVTLVGAVQSLPSMSHTFATASSIIDASTHNLVRAVGATANKPIGTMTAPWAPPVNIIASDDIATVVWAGTKLQRDVIAHPGLKGAIGQIKVGDKTTTLVLESTIPDPSPVWRLTHPLQIVMGYLF